MGKDLTAEAGSRGNVSVPEKRWQLQAIPLFLAPLPSPPGQGALCCASRTKGGLWSWWSCLLWAGTALSAPETAGLISSSELLCGRAPVKGRGPEGRLLA